MKKYYLGSLDTGHVCDIQAFSLFSFDGKTLRTIINSYNKKEFDKLCEEYLKYYNIKIDDEFKFS